MRNDLRVSWVSGLEGSSSLSTTSAQRWNTGRLFVRLVRCWSDWCKCTGMAENSVAPAPRIHHSVLPVGIHPTAPREYRPPLSIIKFLELVINITTSTGLMCVLLLLLLFEKSPASEELERPKTAFHDQSIAFSSLCYHHSVTGRYLYHAALLQLQRW